MKTLMKTVAPAALLMIALTGCSTMGKTADKPAAPAPQAQAPAQPQGSAVLKVDSIDGKKEVAYKCGDKGQSPLNVMYGFKGDQVVVAQVKFQNKLSPNLIRLADNADGNTFVNNGIVWSADSATAANVDKVDGNMLTQRAVQTVNGTPTQVDQIVAKYCKLDKAATAKLNHVAKSHKRG